MIIEYCQTCKINTGHKRAIGVGTLIGSALTFGILLLFIPWYPKRCIICGAQSTSTSSSQSEPLQPNKFIISLFAYAISVIIMFMLIPDSPKWLNMLFVVLAFIPAYVVRKYYERNYEK
jgi:hypothetical protein